MNRRQFVGRSFSCCALSLFRCHAFGSIVSPRPKSILVLGGTFYLGPQIVSAALGGAQRYALQSRDHESAIVPRGAEITRYAKP
jgi:hypothetical protein